MPQMVRKACAPCRINMISNLKNGPHSPRTPALDETAIAPIAPREDISYRRGFPVRSHRENDTFILPFHRRDDLFKWKPRGAASGVDSLSACLRIVLPQPSRRLISNSTRSSVRYTIKLAIIGNARNHPQTGNPPGRMGDACRLSLLGTVLDRRSFGLTFARRGSHSTPQVLITDTHSSIRNIRRHRPKREQGISESQSQRTWRDMLHRSFRYPFSPRRHAQSSGKLNPSSRYRSGSLPQPSRTFTNTKRCTPLSMISCSSLRASLDTCLMERPPLPSKIFF